MAAGGSRRVRHAFLVLGILGIGLGFTLWWGGGAREGRVEVTQPAPQGHDPEREIAELEEPELVVPSGVVRLERPMDRTGRSEVLTAGGEGRPLDCGESTIDVEVVGIETGRPLAGIRLILAPKDDGKARRIQYTATVSDALGRAVFLAPAKATLLLESMRKPGVADSLREISMPRAGERMLVRIELATRPDQLFFGRVVDVESGEPLAGASARFNDGRGGEATSDGNGLFQLVYHSFEPRGVRVEREGYAWTATAIDNTHATPEKAAVVRLSRSARIVARLERGDGPVAGLELRVHTRGRHMQQRRADTRFLPIGDPSWRSEIDGAGVGIVRGLPPHVPLMLDVYEAGLRIERLPTEVSLGIGEERELTIRVGVGCQLLGEAFEADGTPAEGLEIWLLSASGTFRWREGRYFQYSDMNNVVELTQVDAAGRFEFHDVAPGAWLVGLAPVDEVVAPVARSIEVFAEDQHKRVALEVHRGLTIRGRVVGPEGRPVPNAYVRDIGGASEVSAADGTFTLGPVAPGEFQLTGSPGVRPVVSGAFRMTWSRRGGESFARSRPVPARAGDRDVVIRLRRGASLSITVLDPGGEPASAEVELTAEDVRDAGFMARNSSFSADGAHVFRGLLPGVYHATASDALGHVGRIERLTITADTGLLERVLILSKGAWLLPRVTGPANSTRLFARILQDGVPAGFGGMEEPILVVPGQVTAQMQTFDPELGEMIVLATREVTAVLGEQVEVVFDRPPVAATSR